MSIQDISDCQPLSGLSLYGQIIMSQYLYQARVTLMRDNLQINYINYDPSRQGTLPEVAKLAKERANSDKNKIKTFCNLYQWIYGVLYSM